MSIVLREAQTSDAEGIARVHLESWTWAYDGVLPSESLRSLDKNALASHWRNRIGDIATYESTYVLDYDDTLQGFVSFGPQRSDASWLGYAGEVYMLYLNPNLVGLGLGRQLLAEALQELTAEKCFWVSVWVLAKNERARAFYERHGLRFDGARRWDPFGKRSVPVLRYSKALNPVVDFSRLFRTPTI